jgi:subtilase family serine protease
VGITVKWFIYSVLIGWVTYVIGMALIQNTCGCVKDFNNWWTAEYWTKKEGA